MLELRSFEAMVGWNSIEASKKKEVYSRKLE
jgi:hypothetical protein